METEDQRTFLMLGVEVWNKWRDENEIVRPSLSGADLREVDLSSADLSSADLAGADLSGANLTGADLSGANLIGANIYNADLSGANLSGALLAQSSLHEANLSGANLTGADLSGANLATTNLAGAYLSEANLSRANLTAAFLRGANLSGADLYEANLAGADMTRTDLAEARLFDTVFAWVNLSETIGLETCNHGGPSSIDHRTLAMSNDLPVEFLRRAGLPKERIRGYLYGETITIEFTAARWGHLTPIEAALIAKLGDEYIAEKNEDRIVVKLKHAEQFEAALDAVIPVLAAIHKIVPGAIKSLEAAQKGEEPVFIEDLYDALDTFIQHIENAPHPKVTAELMPHEKAMVAIVEGGSRKLAARALEAWFKSGDKIHEKIIDPVSWAIYKNYLQIVGRLKNTTALHKAESKKELPPAQSESD